jgi:hypothetical protein
MVGDKRHVRNTRSEYTCSNRRYGTAGDTPSLFSLNKVMLHKCFDSDDTACCISLRARQAAHLPTDHSLTEQLRSSMPQQPQVLSNTQALWSFKTSYCCTYQPQQQPSYTGWRVYNHTVECCQAYACWQAEGRPTYVCSTSWRCSKIWLTEYAMIHNTVQSCFLWHSGAATYTPGARDLLAATTISPANLQAALQASQAVDDTKTQPEHVTTASNQHLTAERG